MTWNTEDLMVSKCFNQSLTFKPGYKWKGINSVEERKSTRQREWSSVRASEEKQHQTRLAKEMEGEREGENTFLLFPFRDSVFLLPSLTEIILHGTKL